MSLFHNSSKLFKRLVRTSKIILCIMLTNTDLSSEMIHKNVFLGESRDSYGHYISFTLGINTAP